MPHVTIKQVLAHARTHSYGVPNLWGGTVEQALGHIAAAERVRAPLCICHNHELCPLLPVEIGVPLIVNAARHSSVPVATILDHGADLAMAEKCIRHGISSVMFDGSRLPFEENIRQTAEIVRVAHAAGVAVEAELGAVGGSVFETGKGGDVEASMTDPDQAKEFVSRTGIDALAISFGNCHGAYRAEPKLDLERVRKIASLVSVPLVMHGASGLKDDDYGRIIKSGINKINYYTAQSRRACANVRSRIGEGRESGYHDLVNWNINFFRDDTAQLLELLGAAGKATEMDAFSGSRHGEACAGC